MADLLKQFEDLHAAIEKRANDEEDELAALNAAAAAGDESAVARLKELEVTRLQYLSFNLQLFSPVTRRSSCSGRRRT